MTMPPGRWVVALCLSASLLAQDPEPVFRSSTRLVQVDVIVRSKGGAAKGLTRDDFQVFDNGRPQQIAVFSVRDAQTERPLPPARPEAFSNRLEYTGGEPVSATVLLIDGQNTYPEDQGFARLQALKYLDRTRRREYVAVYMLDTTLKVLQEFTTDHDLLRRAVDRFKMVQSLNMQDGMHGLLSGLSGNAANAMRAANFQRQADITSSAFLALSQHLKGLPGRKKLIWITAGMPLTFTQENERNGQTMSEFTNLSPTIYAPMKLLNDANVAIYPIDPRGPMASLADPGITTMIRLAEMTGGQAFYGSNDVAGDIDKAFGDTDLTYTLGFYPIDQSANGSLHSLSVKVNVPDAELRYRRNYSEDDAKPLTDKLRRQILNSWAQEPLNATEIEMEASASPASGKPGFYAVNVVVSLATLQLRESNGFFTGSFEVVITPDVERPKGIRQSVKLRLTPERMREMMATGVSVSGEIRVTKGNGKQLSDKLHLVVMDNATGKSGSVRIPLEPEAKAVSGSRP